MLYAYISISAVRYLYGHNEFNKDLSRIKNTSHVTFYNIVFYTKEWQEISLWISYLEIH